MVVKIIGFSGVLFLIVTGFFFSGGINTAHPSFYRPDSQDLPSEITTWIEFSKEVPLVQEREWNGKRYVLITEGMKPTGGYFVVVKDVIQQQDQLVVRIKSTAPEAEDFVTQALTYPYDLIVLENTDLPLLFVDVNDETRHFLSLRGLELLDRPIAASSDWIKVFTPEPGEEVAGDIQLRGIANVHEGTVSYALISKTGEVLFRHFTNAAFLDWGYFEEQISVPQGLEGKELYLQLYSESMKDGSKMFPVTISLSLSP